MKRFFIFSSVLAMLVAGTLGRVFAESHRVKSSRLPDGARTFVAAHFPKNEIVSAEQSAGLFTTSYEVELRDGTEIDFDNGEWRDIKCRRGVSVPTSVLPSKIAEYLHSNYPGGVIYKVERDRRGYEIEMSNGAELTFDRHGELVGTNDYTKHRPDQRFPMR